MTRLLTNVLVLCAVLTLSACQRNDVSPAPAPQANRAIEGPSGTTLPEDGRDRILVLGNSLAAGYGLSAPELAFPGLIQTYIDRLGWSFYVDNAGVSGETTSGGLSRLPWLLEQPVSVFILELGGNDGLRGVPLATTRENLREMIRITRERYPEADIVLAGMQIPPNLGQAYTSEFAAMYPGIAREMGVHLIPFLLEGVAGIRRLNLPDGIHPTEAGQRIVARTVWNTLEPVLRNRLPATAP